MSNPHDVDHPDAEQLIARLAGPLAPADRATFRAAAQDALARVPCWGEGVVYRTVAALQRAYFVPPDTKNAPTDLIRSTKLRAAPALEGDGRQRRRGEP